MKRKPCQRCGHLDEQLLTARQLQVLGLMCQDLQNKQIAAHLGLSERAVKDLRSKMLKVANCNTSIGVVLWAIDRGYIASKSRPGSEPDRGLISHAGAAAAAEGAGL